MSEIKLSPADAEKIKQLIINDQGDDLVACIQAIFVNSKSLARELNATKIGSVSILNLVAESSQPNCFFKLWTEILKKADDVAKARYPADLFTHILARSTLPLSDLDVQLSTLVILYLLTAKTQQEFTEMKNGVIVRAHSELAPHVHRSAENAKILAEKKILEESISKVISEAAEVARVRLSL